MKLRHGTTQTVVAQDRKSQQSYQAMLHASRVEDAGRNGIRLRRDEEENSLLKDLYLQSTPKVSTEIATATPLPKPFHNDVADVAVSHSLQHDASFSSTIINRLIQEGEVVEDPWIQNPSIENPTAPVSTNSTAIGNKPRNNANKNKNKQKKNKKNSNAGGKHATAGATSIDASPTGGQATTNVDNSFAQPPTNSTRCKSLTCRTSQVLTNPYIFGTLAVVLLYLYVRRRTRRSAPAQGAYRSIAAQYVSSAFDEELSPDDYLSDDEGDEFWTHGKKSIEMGTFKDELTLDEVNG
ncbi:hypothetical protein MPSEU_000946400 [Mayamaea pseudoterrestris]|nr:hypothetical protein MPSEU_000946400 [Mayamaea pseudoterrestris]